jgi:hypothetical protein
MLRYTYETSVDREIPLLSDFSNMAINALPMCLTDDSCEDETIRFRENLTKTKRSVTPVADNILSMSAVTTIAYQTLN